MNNQEVFAKVASDVQEVMGSIRSDPSSSESMITPIMELFIEFGYFEQMELGEPNSIKWMIGTLVSLKSDLVEKKNFIEKFSNLIEQKQSVDAQINEMIETGTI